MISASFSYGVSLSARECSAALEEIAAFLDTTKEPKKRGSYKKDTSN